MSSIVLSDLMHEKKGKKEKEKMENKKRRKEEKDEREISGLDHTLPNDLLLSPPSAQPPLSTSVDALVKCSSIFFSASLPDCLW